MARFGVQHPGKTVITFLAVENIQEQSALGGKVMGRSGSYILSCRIHRALRAAFQGMALLEEHFSWFIGKVFHLFGFFFFRKPPTVG